MPVGVAGSVGFLLWHAHAHQLGARGNAELAEDLAQVIVDRARAEVELCGDLAVGHAGGDEQLLRGRWSSVQGSRRLAVSPVARSSASARSAHGGTPTWRKKSAALRRCRRALACVASA